MPNFSHNPIFVRTLLICRARELPQSWKWKRFRAAHWSKGSALLMELSNILLLPPPLPPPKKIKTRGRNDRETEAFYYPCGICAQLIGVHRTIDHN